MESNVKIAMSAWVDTNVQNTPNVPIQKVTTIVTVKHHMWAMARNSVNMCVRQKTYHLQAKNSVQVVTRSVVRERNVSLWVTRLRK